MDGDGVLIMKYETIHDTNKANYWHQRFFQEEISRLDAEAYKYMLTDPRGRWFLMRLFDNTYVNATTFTGNGQSFFNEGKRAVGINVNRKIVETLGTDGIKLRQQAELEYIKVQKDAERMISERESED